jgi:hypothetical protein
MMDKEIEKKYWQEALRRFRLVDWQPPVSKTDVDKLHAALPPRQADETIYDWLQRVLKTKFTPFTQIIRRAASSSLEQYPLPDVDYLLTEDDSLRFKIYPEAGQIVIKVEALGMAIDELANAVLGLADKEQPQQLIAVIELNADGDGEIRLADNLENRKALANPLIGLIE